MRWSWLAIAMIGCGFHATPVVDADPCSACATPTPACDTATGTCVQCNTDPDCVVGTAPVCDQHVCRACTAHTDCASAACLPDGSCADATSVAYVEAGATDNQTCDVTTPCATVTAALATNKPNVKITGKIVEHVAIDSLKRTIVGGRDAALISATSTGSILDVTGTSAISIQHLSVGGMMSANIGITLHGGTLVLDDVTVDSNTNGGIVVSTGKLVLHQSTVSNNINGGIDINGTSATFDISNNFIFRNGQTASGVVGGVRLLVFANDGTNRLELNTIVDNHVATSTTRAGGVTCDTNGFSAANNIIARNDVNGDRTVANANVVGACNQLTSFIGSDVKDLMFVAPDSAPFDYRIRAGSIAKDQATTVSTVVVDHDGQHRPAGIADDQGAFEIQ